MERRSDSGCVQSVDERLVEVVPRRAGGTAWIILTMVSVVVLTSGGILAVPRS